ncbi:hypothetical protein EGW08_011581 [Elysia chlorotica]|uniref:Uncharacterized protein n=1 Tax=Elysia chlorotica TaxID=188477 RepID=A0A3S0ZLP9_ELYCH|nr:hypothetical protein EGW08_011581 [Elysia chlorotica]
MNKVPQKPFIPDKPAPSPLGPASCYTFCLLYIFVCMQLFSTAADKSPATQPPSAIPRLTSQPLPGPAPFPVAPPPVIEKERESPAPKSPISPVAAPVSPVSGTAPTASFASPTPPKVGAPRPATTFMSPRPYAAPALPPKPAPSLLLSKKDTPPPPSATFIPKPVQFVPPKKPDGVSSSPSPSKPTPPTKPTGSSLPTRPVTFTPSPRQSSALSPKPAPFSPPSGEASATGPRPAPFVPPSRPISGGGPKPAPFYPPTSLPRPVTFAPRPPLGPKPGTGPGDEVTSPVSPTSPTNILDVRKSARMPSGIPKKAATNADIEKMSFREKQKYFEKEIQDSSAPKAPGEEGDVTADHDLDQVLSNYTHPAQQLEGAGSNPTPWWPGAESVSLRAREAEQRASWRRARFNPTYSYHNHYYLNYVRMKSLEVDAVQAQAVIAKAQELSREPANGAQLNHPNHNGDSRVELTGNQILNKGLSESRH